MAGSAARMASTSSMICRVRATDVAGGMLTVQKMVPVSSSGTRPVFVVSIVETSTTIPMTTVTPMAKGLCTSFSTAFLYLPSTDS